MRKLWTIALFTALAASLAADEKSGTAPPSTPKDMQPERVKVYAVGPGVTAPELLPFKVPDIPTEECKDAHDGTVTLSLIVDAAGLARNITFLSALGTDLDKLALLIAAADRFKPGTQDGAPVAVAESLQINIHACFQHTQNGADKSVSNVRLTSDPTQMLSRHPNPPKEAVLAPAGNTATNPDSQKPRVYHVGGNVSGPTPLRVAEPYLPDETRPLKFQGVCLLSLIVDSHGMPQGVKVTRSLGKDLDGKAVEVINNYRFKPAMRNGEPVPVEISIEMDFKLYTDPKKN
jgi:TonB family protein